MKIRRSSPLMFEQLENRLPLAGNVVVSVSGLNVKVTGDNFENQIAIGIEEIEGLEKLIITGLDGTTVTNGEIPLPDEDDFRNLTIDLKKATPAPGNPRGTLGADRVQIGELFLAGNLTITGKNGGVVKLDDMDVVGTTKITFGNGLSSETLGTSIEITDCSLGFPEDEGAGRNVTITTGNNADRVVIDDTEMGKDATINVKNGSNTVAILAERFEGDEEFPFDSIGFIEGKLTVTGGDGEDCLGLLGVVVGKNLKIATGKGDDFVGAADLAVLGTTNVTTKDGNDIVAIGLLDADGNPLPPEAFGNALVGNVTVDTGKGNDLVTAQGTQFGFTDENERSVGGKITVKLGADQDTLLETENEFIGIEDPLAALRGTRGGAGVDTIGSDLSPIEEEVPGALRALQFEREVTLDLNAEEIQAAVDRVFEHVADCFADILAEYGIDIGDNGGGGGDDPDDQIEEAFDSLSGEVPSVSDTIDDPSDVDMFRVFTVGAGETINLTVDPSGGLLDAVVRLFDAEGNEIVIANTGGPGVAENLEFTNNSLQATSVFVGVSSNFNDAYDSLNGTDDADGETTGDYTISLGSGGDPDDQISEATDLGEIGVDPLNVNGTIDNVFDVNMYGFILAVGQTVVITATPGTSELDLALRLFEGVGEFGELPSDGELDGGPGGIEQLTFTNTTGSAVTLFVSVSSFGNIAFESFDGTGDIAGDEIGDYTLNILLD